MKALSVFVMTLWLAGGGFTVAADSGLQRHPAVKTTEAFCDAVAAGEFEKAQKLLVPATYSDAELRKLNEVLRFEEAKMGEAYVGKEQSAVITDEIAPREEAPAHPGARPHKGRWGVCLRLADGNWLIRDLEFLPNRQKLEKFLEQFRKSKPDAEKIKVGA